MKQLFNLVSSIVRVLGHKETRFSMPTVQIAGWKAVYCDTTNDMIIYKDGEFIRSWRDDGTLDEIPF
jgi:hypothetical protein